MNLESTQRTHTSTKAAQNVFLKYLENVYLHGEMDQLGGKHTDMGNSWMHIPDFFHSSKSSCFTGGKYSKNAICCGVNKSVSKLDVDCASGSGSALGHGRTFFENSC